jgi:hypothetical protein
VTPVSAGEVRAAAVWQKMNVCDRVWTKQPVQIKQEQAMPMARMIVAASRVCRVGIRASAVVILVGLSSCSIAPSLEKVQPHAVDISGQWALDRRDSDDVRALLKPLIEKKERHWRALEKRAADEGYTGWQDTDSGQPGGGDASTMQWMRQQRQKEAEELIAFVAPPSQLDINMSTRAGQQEISVKTDKGEGTRVLVPGQASSLFFEVGAFKVNSGWHGDTFIVDLHGSGENSMQIVQYYTVSDAGNRLDLRLEARLPELGKQTFHFNYKRVRSQ